MREFLKNNLEPDICALTTSRPAGSIQRINPPYAFIGAMHAGLGTLSTFLYELNTPRVHCHADIGQHLQLFLTLNFIKNLFK